MGGSLTLTSVREGVDIRAALLLPTKCREKWEAECTECKPDTHVSLSNKGAGNPKLTWSQKKHKKTVLLQS